MADPSCTHFFWSCTDHYLVVPTPSTPPAAPDCAGLQQLFITPSEVQSMALQVFVVPLLN